MNANPPRRVPTPMPPDFPEKAPGMRTAEAAALWDVSERIARRWFREAGIAPKRGPRNGSAGGDTPEQIRICLNCNADSCHGSCAKIKRT